MINKLLKNVAKVGIKNSFSKLFYSQTNDILLKSRIKQ